MGVMRGLAPLGGGVKGGGKPSCCGGGTSVGVGGSVAACNEWVFESKSKVSVITLDRFFESTRGSNVGEINPGPVSDGCKNGFAVAGGLSISSSGTTSIESLD